MEPPGRATTCIRCGYDLSGLPDSAACPECAVPIAESLKGALSNASAFYITRLRWAARLSTAGVVASCLTVTTGAVSMYHFMRSNGAPPPQWLSDHAVQLMWFGRAADAIWWCGLWCLTAADPARPGATPNRLRHLLRIIAAVLGIATLLIWIIVQGWAKFLPYQFYLVLEPLTASLVFTLFVLAPAYIARIAERSTDLTLRRRARQLRVWIPALAAFKLIMWAAYLIGIVFPPGILSPTMRIAVIALVIAPDLLIWFASALLAGLMLSLARAARPTAPSGTS